MASYKGLKTRVAIQRERLSTMGLLTRDPITGS